MELITANNYKTFQQEKVEPENMISPPVGNNKRANSSQFIKANSSEVSLSHLTEECIIPVFAKDNEQTISHGEFIEQAILAIEKVFPGETRSTPSIRVSL